MRTYTTAAGTDIYLADEEVNIEDANMDVLDPVIDALFPYYAEQGNLDHFAIFSAADKEHSDGSRHYGRNTESGLGEALDFRIWHLQNKAGVASSLAHDLGDDYDVVYGDEDHLDHYHVEHDPKSASHSNEPAQ